MENKIDSLWERLKSFPWYWKILFGGVTLLLIVGMYALNVFRRNEEISDNMLVDRNKRKTDKQIEEYVGRESLRKSKRLELKRKRQEIKDEIKRKNEEQKDVIRRIDSADSDELLSIAEQLRDRNRQRKRNRNRS
jgi:hypothetical protein